MPDNPNPCEDVWNELDEDERRILFMGLYTFMSIIEPVETFVLETRSRKSGWTK